MNLTKLSIDRPILVIVLFLVLGILGLYSYTQLRYELLPNIATPFVTITTFYPGASPAEVETALTRPIEEAVSGAEKVKRITSQSLENVSIVMVEFRQDADADLTLQDSQRRINELLSTLPADSKTPTLSKYSLADLPVLRLTVTSKLPDLELGSLLKNQIKPRLAQMPGVGRVAFIGLPETEVQVQLNEERLRALRVSSLQVVNALRASNLNVPSGKVKATNADYTVRVMGKTDALEGLRDVVVARTSGGSVVRLGEVANVRKVQAEIETINRFNGQNTVGIVISKQAGANNVAVSESVRNLLGTLEKDYPQARLQFAVAQDGSEFTLAAADAVTHDLGLAILLVALVMFVFLHSLRSSLIVMVAIPASLLSTFVFMNLLGFSLNLLTLLALSLVIGILVDDSIVVLESIYGKLEKAGNASDETKKLAALEGRTEIGFAAIAITLVDVVVFVPLSLAPGLIGDLMREFSLVVVISTLFSLLVSFTLTPMIASRFGKIEHLSNRTLTGRFGIWFEGLMEQLSHFYAQALAWCLGHRKTVLGVATTLFAGSLLLPGMGFVGGEFTPPTDKGEIAVTLLFPEGQNLQQTDRLARQFETSLRKMPEVRRVFTNVGANPDAFGISPAGNIVEFSVSFAPRTERTKDLATLSREVKERAAQLPGVRMRVYPIGLLGGDGATPIMLIVSGSDRQKVAQEAARVVEAVRQLDGAADVRSSGGARRPEVQVQLDRQRLARYGLTTEEVGAAVRTALAGNDDLKIQQSGETVNLRVQLAEPFRNRTAQLANLSLLSATGQLVQVRQVATVTETVGPAVLERKDRSNSVTIYAQAIGRPVGDIGVDIQKAVTDLKLDPTVNILYGGDLELQDESFGKLGVVFLAAILFMYLIMVALYNSWVYPFVVLFSIPLALMGALLALALTMNSLNVFTILGLIMMLGLVAKNAILLVDRANHNRENGLSTTEALLEAGRSRLRPILMTTLAMVIGMLPIALAEGAGAELKTGLAWALIGGLSVSMILTLLVVPVVYGLLTRSVERESKSAHTRQLLKPVVTILMLLGFAQLATAQTSPLSLSSIPALIRQNNGEVRVAEYEGRRADVRLEEVRRTWWPTLNAAGTYQYNIRKPVFFFPAFNIDPNTGSFAFDDSRMTPVDAGLTHAYNAGVNLAMPLIQPDLKLAKQQAMTARQQANENTRATVNRQVAEAKKLYLGVLLAREQRTLLLHSLQRAETLLAETRQRYRVQLATDADTLRAFVELANLRPSLSKLDRNVRTMTAQLSVLLGFSTGTNLNLTDSLTFQEATFYDNSLLLSESPNRRPELRLLNLNLVGAKQQAEAERIRRLPTLSLIGQASTLAQLNNFNFRDSRWPVVAYVGLQLNIPLFNPTTGTKMQQARLAQSQVQEQIHYTRQLITNEIQISLDSQAEALERLQTQAQVVRAAERSYTLLKSRYQQGLAKWSELTDADLALRQAQSNQIQAIYDFKMAQIALELATGQDT